jgi:hypothetical protein
LLEEGLPDRFGELPVRFPVTWDPSVSHKVEVATVADFTASPVFADRTRTLAAARTLLAWYPPNVERYVLAAGWQRLCQQLPMLGRTAEAGDELGSRLLRAGLANDLLWLAFALSSRWAPYPTRAWIFG